MQMLAVCGQDLRRFELVLWEDGICRASTVTDDPPEKYLARVDLFLGEQKTKLSDLSGIIVVTGPGSFTASRLSVTMVNAFAFTQNLPVLPVENPNHLSLLDLLQRIDLSTITSVPHATPHYDRPPFITTKKQAVDESLGTNP